MIIPFHTQNSNFHALDVCNIFSLSYMPQLAGALETLRLAYALADNTPPKHAPKHTKKYPLSSQTKGIET